MTCGKIDCDLDLVSVCVVAVLNKLKYREPVISDQLSLTRLKGRDFENFALLSQVGVPHSIIFMSMITGMPIQVVQELDADDWLDLAELIKDFIPARFIQEAMASGPDSQTGQDTPA